MMGHAWTESDCPAVLAGSSSAFVPGHLPAHDVGGIGLADVLSMHPKHVL